MGRKIIEIPKENEGFGWSGGLTDSANFEPRAPKLSMAFVGLSGTVWGYLGISGALRGSLGLAGTWRSLGSPVLSEFWGSLDHSGVFWGSAVLSGAEIL